MCEIGIRTLSSHRFLGQILGLRKDGRGGRRGAGIQFCSSTGTGNAVYRSTGTEHTVYSTTGTEKVTAN